VERIELCREGRQVGELRFRYLQDVDGGAGRFSRPGPLGSPYATRRASSGVLWLVQLAEGTLGQDQGAVVQQGT